MFSIDFNTLPEEKKKNLSQEEITSLNGLFMDPTIQQQLEDIEEQRKIRQKWKYIVYGWSTIITLIFSFILGVGDSIITRLLSWFFYTIGTGDNSFSPVIYLAFGLYWIGMGILYKKFSSKIEIPLKTEVLKKMCPILYSKLDYSHDTKYSFDELELLSAKKFLSSYDTIEAVEDSTHFEIENNGKLFSVNGFEVKTSEVRWSGKDRKRETTNHCYLMRAVFPNARIPLQNDLLIVKDQADGWSGILYIFAALWFMIWSCASFILFLFITAPIGISLFFDIIAGWIVSYIMYYYRKKHINTNRVQLENMEFEKLFDVKCEDQITSRMIITPAFMDRIVSFVNKTGNEYEFLMQGNIMYIKRQIHGTYLEAWTEKNILTNLKWFTQFYTDMREIIQFTYDMNLMYLSKTDTTKTIETEANIVHVDPIRFVKESGSQFGFIGNMISRFAPTLKI